MCGETKSRIFLNHFCSSSSNLFYTLHVKFTACVGERFWWISKYFTATHRKLLRWMATILYIRELDRNVKSRADEDDKFLIFLTRKDDCYCLDVTWNSQVLIRFTFVIVSCFMWEDIKVTRFYIFYIFSWKLYISCHNNHNLMLTKCYFMVNLKFVVWEFSSKQLKFRCFRWSFYASQNVIKISRRKFY